MGRVAATIDDLKKVIQLQEEAIGSLEAYERAVLGCDSAEVQLSGYSKGYASELGYLRLRRLKLDMAIACFEKYAEEQLQWRMPGTSSAESNRSGRAPSTL